MNEKELYLQRKQAQLDEWQAEEDKLKARASGASADAQVELNRQIKTLEGRIEESKSQLAEVANASGDAWVSLKDGAESAWNSVKAAFSDAAASFRK